MPYRYPRRLRALTCMALGSSAQCELTAFTGRDAKGADTDMTLDLSPFTGLTGELFADRFEDPLLNAADSP